MEKYLIVGTGGVGGSIAGFLALAGKDVTCIARGKHLEAIREKGLHLRSDLKGNHFLPVQACTAEEYNEKANVIFVCVKGYSLDSIKDLLEKASDKDTLIIPILNVYGTGPRIGQLVSHVTVLDGCIYIVGFVSGPGEITQMGKIFRLVFGARPQQGVAPERLETIADVLRKAGIKADISDDINRDTFIKWSFISTMACTGVTMKSGLTNASAEEYITKKAIAENANSMILLADHSKFGRISLMTYSSMEKLDAIVTDQPLPEEYDSFCQEHGIRVMTID